MTSSCGIPGVPWDKKWVEDLEGSGSKLAGALGLPTTGDLWDLWMSDTGTKPIFMEWINDRKALFGVPDLKLGKLTVDKKVVDWHKTTVGKNVMLNENKPQVGDEGVSIDTIAGMTCLWHVRRLMLAKPSREEPYDDEHVEDYYTIRPTIIGNKSQVGLPSPINNPI